MEILKYNSDMNAMGTILCPYLYETYVGSTACWACKYFKRADLKNKEVHCMFNEQNNEKK